MDASPTTTIVFLLTLLLQQSLLPTPSASPSLATSVRCHKDDYTALMKIKEAFHNSSDLASWVPNTDCCDWLGVNCSDINTNRVNELFLGTHFSCQIPAEVGDLQYLEILVFIGMHNLTGTIPSTITQLKHLQLLMLSGTSLSGPIPSFLSQLTNLTNLELSNSKFSGSIPSSLSQLSKLTGLLLNLNSLTGEIPESFGKFKQPLYLDLSQNQLSGEIPKSLGDVDFITVDLSRNKLQGDASMLFKANGSTETIVLSRNTFEFDLSKVEIAKKLQELDISRNKIYGSIPEAITGSDLQYLDVSYNRLCGEIPQGGKVQNFDSDSFSDNNCLCGSPLAACK